MIPIAEILKGLGLSAINSGGSTGAHWWASGENTSLLESVNPATCPGSQAGRTHPVAWRIVAGT